MNNPTEIIDVTLSLDTGIYASGDVLAATQVISEALSADFRSGIVQTITVVDKDDQKQAINFYLLDADVSIGTENSTPSISDANAASIYGKIAVAAADYDDLGGVSVACISGLAIPCRSIPNTRDIAIAAVCNSGTPTYTAAGIVVRLGILRDQRTS